MVGRFAPSPTGPLHVGNGRTALLAWLFARSAGSRFVMRMEDLDAGRVRPGIADAQLASLAALGIDWDGPVMAQSSRSSAYDAALASLRSAGLLYECFCTRAEIREAASAPHGALPEGAYPGTCRELGDAEREVRRAAGRSPALRVRAGAAGVAFVDRVLGEQAGVVDDFVVLRGDGAVAYNLAVVVDDAWQEIDEVVRGADLVGSTPRQLWLAGALGVRSPRSWAHVALVLGADGARLAKRHGTVLLDDLDPGDAVAWCARSLGLPPARTASALLDAFDPDALGADPTVWTAA